MMTCEPFEPSHIAEMGRASAPVVWGNLDGGWTLRRDGKILCCGGAVPTEGGYHVWAAIAPGAPMIAVTRAVRRTFDTLGRVNLVATCEDGFAAGARWLELLGFTRQRIEPCYANGRDHIVYLKESA